MESGFYLIFASLYQLEHCLVQWLAIFLDHCYILPECCLFSPNIQIFSFLCGGVNHLAPELGNPSRRKGSYLSKETLPIYNKGLAHVSVSDSQNKTSGVMQA